MPALSRKSHLNGGNPLSGGASYSYDGDRKRVRSVTASGTTIYVYNAEGQLNGFCQSLIVAVSWPIAWKWDGAALTLFNDLNPWGQETARDNNDT